MTIAITGDVAEAELNKQQRRLFGDRLYAVRCQLGLTRRQFSDRFGLPYGTVKSLEDGRFNPLPSTRLVVRILELNPELVETAATVDRNIGLCRAVKQ